jgi:hypothetical protein
MARFPGHEVPGLSIHIGSLGPNPSPGNSGNATPPRPVAQTEQFPQGPTQPSVPPKPGGQQ